MEFNEGFTLTEIKESEMVAAIQEALKERKTGVWFVNEIADGVLNCNQGARRYDADYCDENDIPVLKLNVGGGSIVKGSEDFMMAIACQRRFRVTVAGILENIRNVLQNHTDRAVTVNGNDILVDGVKVSGTASWVNADTIMIGSYFSFSDKSALIREICPLPRTGKVPGYIDFVTREEFKKAIASWLQVQYE